MHESRTPSLTVENLTCRYNGAEDNALDKISFNAFEGEILGIIGANGAGKSTLIKSMLGLIPATGKVRFFGEDFAKNRTRIAYIPQRRDIDWDFPVSALDVCLMGIYPRIGAFKRIQKFHKEEALSYLKIVDLESFANRPIGALSGGQQQRVFIARALAQKAEIIILDEPFAGVDQKSQSALFDLLVTMKNNKNTILIVHHNLEAANKYFDRVLLLNKGLIALGKPQDVMNQENIGLTYGNWVA